MLRETGRKTENGSGERSEKLEVSIGETMEFKMSAADILQISFGGFKFQMIREKGKTIILSSTPFEAVVNNYGEEKGCKIEFALEPHNAHS